VADTSLVVTAILVLALTGVTVVDLFVDEELLDMTNLLHLFALIGAGVSATVDLEGTIEGFEPNNPAISDLTVGTGSIAAFDPYPATVADNPLAAGRPDVTLIDLVLGLMEHFGVFHQKIAVIKNDRGIHAYCGGVDLNPDRLDTFEHKIDAPFKDVHARIDGPAVRELAETFAQRWGRTRSEPLAVPTPEYSDLPTPGSDLVQIARTYYAPEPTGTGTSGFSWAPTGETTVYRTTLNAIRNAKEFIYIEDQYLTPPSEYIEAIQRAAERVAGIVIMIPATPDQPFGLGPRRAFVHSLPDNVHVGVMRRGYNAIRTTRAANTGRLYLDHDLEEHAVDIPFEEVRVKQESRVPGTPCWLIVDDEVMYATSKLPSTGTRVTTFRVLRGEHTHFLGRNKGTKTKKHKEGAPVTVVDFAGIYVHSKVMIVDDVFASIGSANVNRRGYFSDGECNVFAMNERMRFHETNWVRTLRKRLWAEALNIPERVADGVLHDPVGALDLFKRSRLKGNRFVSFDSEFVHTEMFSADGTDGSGPTILGIEALTIPLTLAKLLGVTTLSAEAQTVFDVISDPSSYADPSPDEDP
jgi:phosphatidylserine/phosphatidylglycerophosphate/cardiolipin synthase-like enzyme